MDSDTYDRPWYEDDRKRPDTIPEQESREIWKDLKDSECNCYTVSGECNCGKKDNWCCRIMKELGYQWLEIEQMHNLVMDIHRIKLEYCPHCGRKL